MFYWPQIRNWVHPWVGKLRGSGEFPLGRGVPLGGKKELGLEGTFLRNWEGYLLLRKKIFLGLPGGMWGEI